MKTIVCSSMLLVMGLAAQAQQGNKGAVGGKTKQVFERPEEIFDCPENRPHAGEVLLMTVPSDKYTKKVRSKNGEEKWEIVETGENRQSVIDGNFLRCPYRTKRLGRARTDSEGGVYSNQVPVYVQSSERDSVLHGLKKF